MRFYNNLKFLDTKFKEEVDENEIFKNCLIRKLNISLTNYNVELNKVGDYLKKRQSFKVLKGFNKYKK